MQNQPPSVPANGTVTQEEDGTVSVQWDSSSVNESVVIRYRLSSEATSTTHDFGYSEGIRYVFNKSDLKPSESDTAAYIYLYGSNRRAPLDLSDKEKCSWIFENSVVSNRAPTLRINF